MKVYVVIDERVERQAACPRVFSAKQKAFDCALFILHEQCLEPPVENLREAQEWLASDSLFPLTLYATFERGGEVSVDIHEVEVE